MTRYDDAHVSVRISDEGLTQAYGKSEAMREIDVRRIERIHTAVTVLAAIALGAFIGYAWVV